MAELDTLPWDEEIHFECECGSIYFSELKQAGWIVSKARIDRETIHERRRRLRIPLKTDAPATLKCGLCGDVWTYDTPTHKFIRHLPTRPEKSQSSQL